MTTPAAQASFDDLGTPLAALTYCVVDLETTGGAETDRITEIGAVKVRGGEVLGEFQTLVNPRTHVPPLIAVLTGITNTMVAAAPTLREVLPAFLAFAQGTVVVAHNAPFDTGFLRRACENLGYPYPRWPVLDTATLARVILLRDEVPNCKLGTLARHFRTTVTPNHRALTDAQATVDVLHGLMERVGNLGVHTLEDLQEFSRQVSPQRRSKRTWAAGLPETAGVYLFVAEHPAVPGTAAARRSDTSSTWASPRTSAPASAPTSPRRRSGGGWTRWSAWPPASRRSPARPSCRPTCWSCGSSPRTPRATTGARSSPTGCRGSRSRRRCSRGSPSSARCATTAPPTSGRSRAARRPRTSCSRSTTASRCASARPG